MAGDLYRVVAVYWWSTEDVIGLVVIDSFEGKLKAYIGAGVGLDEVADAQRIAGHGTRVHNLDMVKAVFPHLVDREWYKG
jgi:hypothetical protein